MICVLSTIIGILCGTALTSTLAVKRASKQIESQQKERAAKAVAAYTEKPLMEGTDATRATQIPVETEAPTTCDIAKDGVSLPSAKIGDNGQKGNGFIPN